MAQPTPPKGGHPQEPQPAAPLATSGSGAVAMQFVTALSKAARSFTLYAPSNAVVRQFLADYQARAAAATEGSDLVLDVHPFELLREGEVVYREEDRERSLAFRLFRDGVRRLTFRPGVPWEELLAFLEILAVRYVGVRQQEEDVITLLRKGEFKGIGFAAVEGFTPEEDNPEPEGVRRARGEGSRAPAGFDSPFPLLPPPGPVAWREVPAEALAPLHAGDSAELMAADAVRLAGRLLAEAERGLVSARELQLFLLELRDYFIADAALVPLADLAELVGRSPPGAMHDDLVRSLGDPRLLDALLAAVPPGSTELPPQALRLIPLVSAQSALDLLAAEPDEGRRQVLALIAEARLPADAAAIVERLTTLDAKVARALVHAIGAKAPSFAAQAAATLLDHADESLQVAALQALEGAGAEVPVQRLLRLLHAPRESVRIGVASVLARSGKSAAFPAVHDALLSRSECSVAEADAFGSALARLDQRRAAPLFAEWLKPRRGLLKALTRTRQDEFLRAAAASGLAAFPSPEALAQLEALAKADDDETFRRHCQAVLARRRRQGGRHG
jgi:HEAT repeat protein